MDEPIRTDKEDRYLSENSKNPPLLSKPRVLLSKNPLSKRKWVMLIIALLILILLLSLTLFKPQQKTIDNVNNADNVGNSQLPEQTTDNQIATDSQYQTLTPPAISEEATKSKNQTGQAKERLEISGEITDLLAQKIAEINSNNDNSENIANEKIELKSQNPKINSQFNEQPLEKTIEDAHYTIQMMATSSLENAMAFAKQHQLVNYQIYETRFEQKPWFVLIKGNYPTTTDAKKAIQALPQGLQKNNPWIKSGIKVNKEKQVK